MALTESFEGLMLDRAKREPKLRRGMLCDAVTALAGGETNVAKAILRTVVNAGIGVPALAERLGIPPESLARALSPAGDPTLTDFGRILAVLGEAEGIEFEVRGKRAESAPVAA